MNSIRRIQLALTAGVAAIALTALPVGFDSSTMSVDLARAVADSGNGNGHGNGHANGQENVASDSQGATASSLGALNAAHASDTALANAAPNSRVGKIATYRDAELAAQDAAAAEAAINDALANDDFNNDGVVDANDVPLSGGTLTQADIDALDTNGDGVLDSTDVTNSQTAAEQAQAAADAALIDAANKDITDGAGNVLSDIRDAVNDLLGI